MSWLRYESLRIRSEIKDNSSTVYSENCRKHILESDAKAYMEEFRKLVVNVPYIPVFTTLYSYLANSWAEITLAVELGLFIFCNWGGKREPIGLLMIGAPAFFFLRIFASSVQPSTLSMALALFSVVLLGSMVSWTRTRLIEG